VVKDHTNANDERYSEPDGLPTTSLPTRRARRVEILGWEEMHVDDEVLSGPSIGTVSIRIEAAALQFLA
jgi:hypothetical protein